MIFVTFGKIGLLFSVYNISKNYLTFDDSWIDIYKIHQSVFFVTLSHFIKQKLQLSKYYLVNTEYCVTYKYRIKNFLIFFQVSVYLCLYCSNNFVLFVVVKALLNGDIRLWLYHNCFEDR